jgi:hypothetical protein
MARHAIAYSCALRKYYIQRGLAVFQSDSPAPNPPHSQPKRKTFAPSRKEHDFPNPNSCGDGRLGRPSEGEAERPKVAVIRLLVSKRTQKLNVHRPT